MRGLRLLKAAVAACVCIAAIGCCTKPDGAGKDATPLSLSIPILSHDRSSDAQFVTVDAPSDMEWTLALVFSTDAGDTPWARLSQTSGKGYRSDIAFSWDFNSGEEARSCLLVLSNGGEGDDDSITLQFTQLGAASVSPRPTVLKSDPVANWMELPQTGSEEDGLYFITHDMSLAGSRVRNYSFCYDVSSKLSLWVAYPLNARLAGSGSRSDAWGLDPKVPDNCQQILYRGYRGGYDRGHQLPSADRYTDNPSTFYFTNMTPQRGSLNQNAWAGLETQVRAWADKMDTLYVVTGADFRNSSEYAEDNMGDSIPVPTAYFKALLGYKAGSSLPGSVLGYLGIAFWYEHRSYSTEPMAQSLSIDELEEKLGYDLFVNLPAAIGENNAAKVESSISTWWK